jgi:hypothetical protein
MNNSTRALALISAGLAACTLHAGLFVGPDSGVTGVGFSSTGALKFTVNPGFSVSVSALDAFVDNGTSLSDTIHLRLLDSTDSILASAAITGTGTSGLVGGRWAESSITPLTLAPGNYAITGDAWVANQLDIGGGAAPVYHGGSAITALDTFFGGAGLQIFTGGGWNEAPGGVNGERAVNFEFTATSVPEPTTYAIVSGLGLVGFGLWRRKASK